MENIKVRLRPHVSFWTKPLLNYGFRKCFHIIQKYVFLFCLNKINQSFKTNEPKTFCTYRSWLLCCEINTCSSSERLILNEVKPINYRVLKYVLINLSVQISRYQFSLLTDPGFNVYREDLVAHENKTKSYKIKRTLMTEFSLYNVY